MSRYRRAAVPGGTYFFTVVTERRQPILTDPVVRSALREAIVSVRQTLPFKLMLGCCFLIICMPSGPCRKVTLISPVAGA